MFVLKAFLLVGGVALAQGAMLRTGVTISDAELAKLATETPTDSPTTPSTPVAAHVPETAPEKPHGVDPTFRHSTTHKPELTGHHAGGQAVHGAPSTVTRPHSRPLPGLSQLQKDVTKFVQQSGQVAIGAVGSHLPGIRHATHGGKGHGDRREHGQATAEPQVPVTEHSAAGGAGHHKHH